MMPWDSEVWHGATPAPGGDRIRPPGNRRRERHSGASYAPVSFVPDEDSKLFEVTGFPGAKVTFLNRHARSDPPAKFRLVYEPDVDIQETLLKFVFDPVHDFPLQTTILVTRNESARIQVVRLLLSHGRRPPFFSVPGAVDPLTPFLNSLAAVRADRCLLSTDLFLRCECFSSKRSSSDQSQSGRMTTRGGSPFRFRLCSESRTSR